MPADQLDPDSLEAVEEGADVVGKAALGDGLTSPGSGLLHEQPDGVLGGTAGHRFGVVQARGGAAELVGHAAIVPVSG